MWPWRHAMRSPISSRSIYAAQCISLSMTIRRNLSAKLTRRAVEWRSPPTVLAGIDATIWVHYSVQHSLDVYSQSVIVVVVAEIVVSTQSNSSTGERCAYRDVYDIRLLSAESVDHGRWDPTGSVHPPFLSRQLVRSLNVRTWCIECTGSRELWCYLYCDCPSTKVMVPKDIRSRLHVLVFILFPT